MRTRPAVVALDDPRARDASLTGTKAAALARLAGGYPVPAGMCVTSAAFAGREHTAAACAEAYGALGAEEVASVVAVRSSARAEDGRASSSAGLYTSYLALHGEREVTAAALEIGSPETAVLIQRFVEADCTAVAFSLDPATGDDSVVVVNAVLGLGDVLTQGTVASDRWVVRKSDLTVIERLIADKPLRSAACEGGTTLVAVPRGRRRAASLDDAKLRAAVRMTLALSSPARPADVELSWSGGRIFVLQCRPATSRQSSIGYPSGSRTYA